MKPIPVGHTARHNVVVRDDMTVDFEQDDPKLGRLHPVYATYWLVKHMELVSRKIILPFLDADEEGVGLEVSVTHLASALPGMTVKLSAEHLKTGGNRVYARCEAVSELGDVVGTGATTQVVLKRERLEGGFDHLRERWNRYRTLS